MGQSSSSETVQDQTEVDGPQSPVKVLRLRPLSSGSYCEPSRNMFRDHLPHFDDSPFSVVRRYPVFYSTIMSSRSTDAMFSPLQPVPRKQRLKRSRKALLDELQSYNKEIRILEQKRKWAIEALILDDLQSYSKEVRPLRRGLSSESLSDMFMDDLPMFQPPPPRSKPWSSGPSCESLKSDRSKEQLIDFWRKPSLSKPGPSGPSCESLKSDRSKEQPIDFRRTSSLVLLESPESPEPLKRSRSTDPAVL